MYRTTPLNAKGGQTDTDLETHHSSLTQGRRAMVDGWVRGCSPKICGPTNTNFFYPKRKLLNKKLTLMAFFFPWGILRKLLFYSLHKNVTNKRFSLYGKIVFWRDASCAFLKYLKYDPYYDFFFFFLDFIISFYFSNWRIMEKIALNTRQIN